MVELAVRVAAGALFLLGNAFFVATEFALTRVRQFPREAFAGDPGLDRAWELTERLELYLSGCQVGITICSVGLGVVLEPAFVPLVAPVLGLVGLGGTTLHAVAFAAAFVVVNVLHLVLGEQAPTYLGVERARGVARRVAPVIAAWTRLMWPIIWVADRAAKATLRLGGVEMTRAWTEDEPASGGRADLRAAMGRVLARGGVSEDRRAEVLKALAIGETPVRDVMVPRDGVVALSVRDPPDRVLTTLRDHPYTRYPLVDADLDDPVGTLYAPAVLREAEALASGDLDLADVASGSMTVPADTPVSRLIDRFQELDQELALVVEDGRVVGLVTATDALEAIVGDLRDPLDRDRQSPQR